MEFKELNIDDKKDILDLMCILSANVNNLMSKSDRPERTEMEVLEHLSDIAKDYWKDFLLSKLRE